MTLGYSKVSSWLLLAILLIGAALRFVLLSGDVPPLYADELDAYVSMQSIATTGHDIDGTLQPFLYSNLERHPPIYGVTAYLSTRIFGNTPFAWRMPAAVFGLISIALLYLIVVELTRRRSIALLAALFMAIEPISVHFSRIGWPPASVLPVLLGGLWFLLVALRKDRPGLSFPCLAAGAVLIGLCPYTYGATWFYAALLVGGLFAFNRPVFHNPENRRKLLAAATIALVIAGPGLLIAWTDPHTVERTRNISTFVNGVNGESLGIFFNHYFSHFGWPFLFATGATDAHYMKGYGALYWWYGPLIIAGAIYAPRYARNRALYAWMWLWLLVYPLGAALTNDGATAHPARTIAGSPVLCIFAAVGCYALFHIGKLIESRVWRKRYRAGLATVLALCVLGSVWSFSTWYFGVYPVATASDWESGSREAFAAVRAHQQGYARLCLLGFNPWHIDTLQRYYLPNTPLAIIENGNQGDCTQPATLILATQAVVAPGFTVISETNGIDGKLFAVLEARPPSPGP
jgi:4-amino-4-deoxy-L-arabinose transferase-like glycosyltransferase